MKIGFKTSKKNNNNNNNNNNNSIKVTNKNSEMDNWSKMQTKEWPTFLRLKKKKSYKTMEWFKEP